MFRTFRHIHIYMQDTRTRLAYVSQHTHHVSSIASIAYRRRAWSLTRST